MSSSILATKLFIPSTRPKFVPRPRLIDRLNEGLHRKLTFISAPAGFGKTTLVSEWVAGIESQIAWISLDEGDNDPTRFLTYIIASINQIESVDSTFGNGSLSMLQSPQPPSIEEILTSLINEIAAIPGKILLILDDYHLIKTQLVQNLLSFLLENMPPQLHLVIATREDPHLSLVLLRARGELTELRAADLRFTSNEAVEFLNQVMELELSDEDVAALESRTEGWISGMQLAALSMQGSNDAPGFIKSFTGSHRHVLDYLIEEILEQQPKNIQTFLLQTAILDRFSSSLCDAVTGGKNSQLTLEMLDRRNLFIVPLDNERCWYRYHHLFADMLRQRLHQTQAESGQMLHLRASQWYEQNRFTDESIEHALRGEDIERAARLIEEHANVVWERGEHTKLWRWMSGLPVEEVLSKPQLCIFQAWKLYVNGKQDASEGSLHAAEEALITKIELISETTRTERGRLPDSTRMKIQGRAATIRAHLAFHRGDVEKMKKYSLKALEYLPKQDKSWRNTATVSLGDAYSISGDLESAYRIRSGALESCNAAGSIYPILAASMRLALTMRMQGKLHQVLDICQGQSIALKDSGLSQINEFGFMLAIWGEVRAELNDLNEAIHLVRKGKVLTERDKNVGTIGWSYLSLMRVLFSMGDYNGVTNYVQKTKEFYREFHVPEWILYRMSAWQVRSWLAQGMLDAASQWVEERDLDVYGDLTYLNEREYIALARILIEHERLDESIALLKRLLEAQEKSGHITKTIEIMMLQALTLQSQGKPDQATATLEKALILAKPGGFIRIFIDEGSPMETLLKKKVEDSTMKEYVRKLLVAFTDNETRPSSLSLQSMIEPLSERELEVLQLIAKGLTNPEIASRLYLSTNTVKVHSRNIYAKLGVNNRVLATAKGKELGILSSASDI